MTLTFVTADLTQHRDTLMRFNVDYGNWVGEGVLERFGLVLEDLLGASMPDYVAGMLDKFCDAVPPVGIFYLVFDGDLAVGMGGLRQISDGICEIKRIYVPKTSRGLGVGQRTLDRLMVDARDFGYKAVVLETGPFMRSAHRVYEAAGFVDIPPYLEAEVPHELRHDWRFMRCEVG